MNDLGWGSPTILALFGATALGLLAFVLVERRAAAPTVDLSFFRLRAFSGASVAILIFTLGSFGVFLYTSLYLQNVLGYSAVEAGAALLPWVAMLVLIAPLSGKLSQRIAPRLLVAAGLFLMAAGLLLLSGIDAHSSYRDLLPGLIIGGLGGALTIPLNAVAIGVVPVSKSGVASGIFNTAREAGGALGIAIIGAVLMQARANALASGTSAAGAFAAGYSDGLLAAALLSVIAALVVLFTLPSPAHEGTSGATGPDAGPEAVPVRSAA